MSTTTQLLTADDLWNLPDHGGCCELVKGELRTMSPTGFDHGGVSMNVGGPLHQHVRKNKLGVVVSAEAGFIIRRDPDTVRVPDVGFVRRERIPKSGRPERFWLGAPDLVVETTSPSDTVAAVNEKIQEWLTAGVQLVLVLRPRQKSVTCYRPDRAPRKLGVGDTLDGEDVVPGFRISVAEIFD